MNITRHTLAAALRIPQWQRLIDSIHRAQEAAGYAGRQFGPGEMRFFGSTLVGLPVEYVDFSSSHTPAQQRANFAAYWVERQQYEMSDGALSVRYVLKAAYGDSLATTHTIAEAAEFDPSPEWEDRTAADFVRQAQQQTPGKKA